MNENEQSFVTPSHQVFVLDTDWILHSPIYHLDSTLISSWCSLCSRLTKVKMISVCVQSALKGLRSRTFTGVEKPTIITLNPFLLSRDRSRHIVFLKIYWRTVTKHSSGINPLYSLQLNGIKRLWIDDNYIFIFFLKKRQHTWNKTSQQ